MSKEKETIIECHRIGYRIIDEVIYNPSGDILTGTVNKSGYHQFKPTKHTVIRTHKFIAYQKYGEEIFENRIHIRHLDNNKLNNSDENIVIGTASDNAMDIPKEQRSIMAGKNSRIYHYEEIKKYYDKTKSYTDTKRKFNISSSGTLHYILNK